MRHRTIISSYIAERMSDEIVDYVLSDNAKCISSYNSDQKVYHQTL